MQFHRKSVHLLLVIFVLFSGGDLTLEGCLGYRNLAGLPEVRVTKWISDADRDYIDDSLELEWNEKVDADAIHISGFGSHEYVVSQHVAGLVIECRAQYPVEWEFHNAHYVTEDLNGIQMKTFRRSESVLDSKEDTFSSTLEITMESNRATGNYTCKSTHDPSLSYDIFLFWEGSSPDNLVLSGRVLEITVARAKSVNIPCYVSTPDASVTLFKEVNGDFKPVPTVLSPKFDPKVGFDITFSNISDVLGRYRCESGELEDDSGVMEVLIRKGSGENCKGSQCIHRQVSPGTSFYFDEKTEELICCGRGGLKRPRLHTFFCLNPSTCRMFEPAMYLAVGKSGKRSGNGSCTSERVYPRDFGLVRCKGEGIDVFSYMYTEFWTPQQENLRAVFEWKQLNPQNMMYLAVHATSPNLYVNQMVTVSCQTLHSYFSDGIKWAIRFKNGSMHYFDSELSTEHDPRLHGIRSTYLKLSAAMSEIICFAPQWNSTQWVEKSLALDVKPSRSPVIIGDVVEELTFSLNDTEKMLECATDAEPPAKIKWMRNEEEVPRSMVIYTANGTSVLMFKTVTYQTHGVYKCIGKNEVGQVKKTFRIFVEDDRYSAWSTAFAVVIPILVVSLVCVVIYFMWKMQLQKKVVDHLTRVVFRESNSA